GEKRLEQLARFLELAYSGADLKGVVSFHGGLTAPQPAELKGIKAAILVLHGADDPHVSAADIAAFQDAMRQGGLDWQMVFLGGAVHAFMNPEAGQQQGRGRGLRRPGRPALLEVHAGLFQGDFCGQGQGLILE
ncbi:MAG TPA: dienelactone hydrolase family protein, partial [Desulfobaccales bacterium]